MEFRPLDALLKPRSAAIVVASPRRNVGGRIFRNMSRCGFNGPLFPVNPRYENIDGVTCYPNVQSLPEVPDCVAIAVPYEHVFEPLEAAAHRGVKAAVVVAEGFADSATDVGLKRQERLTHIASEYGMAISGPNCMGLVGMKVGLGAAFTNLPTGLDIGGVSLVSQSGGLLNAAVELGHNRGIGYNYLISGGNEAVITSADFIDWLADDPGTSVIIYEQMCATEMRRQRKRGRRAPASTSSSRYCCLYTANVALRESNASPRCSGCRNCSTGRAALRTSRAGSAKARATGPSAPTPGCHPPMHPIKN